MPIKSLEEQVAEAKQELQPVLDAASPGVLDVLEIMERYDRSNEGAETYAAFVHRNVHFSSNNTTGR